MRCSDVERLLPQYADDALPATQAEGIASHLVGCSECRIELTHLQRSLDALNLAAREPAPDLWSQFRARVAQSSAAVCCREIEALLPSFADGELERPQTLRVRDHLAECAACAALEAAHSRPMRTLEKVGRAPASIELWPAFTARLGQSLSCREVEDLLPTIMAGEPTAQTVSFQYHLHACRACAGSLAAYERSLSALSRVGQAVPEVDLWPAFAARLEEGATPRRANVVGAGWLPALGAWLRGPLLQPAVGFAAFALLTVAGQLLSQSASGRLWGTELARLTQGGTGEIVANQRPTAPAKTETARVTLSASPSLAEDLPVAKDTTVPARKPRTASVAPPRMSAPVATPLDDPGSELPGSPHDPGVRVAFNLPATGGEFFPASERAYAPEFSAPSIVSERDGMQAVVQAVELLAGSEDALNSPFDSKANDK